MVQQALGHPQSSVSQQRHIGEQPTQGRRQAEIAQLNQCKPCNEWISKEQFKKHIVTLAESREGFVTTLIFHLT